MQKFLFNPPHVFSSHASATTQAAVTSTQKGRASGERAKLPSNLFPLTTHGKNGFTGSC
jgi:hypothetical protein